LTSLPVDPVNASASSNFYAFVTDGRTWALTSLMESERHAPSAGRDGGNDFARFEAGNNLALWTTASGLVGYWSFDGTGNIVHGQTVGLRDTSGRDNHGTAGNTNAAGMAFAPGRVGNAVSFDGVDDFVNVTGGSTMTPHGHPQLTIMAWANKRTTSGGMIAHQNGPFLFRMGNVMGNGTFQIHNAVNGWRGVSSNVVLQNNVWHHLVMVYDGVLIYNYVDGRLDGTGSQTGGLSAINCVGIGRETSGGCVGVPGNHFNGLIDEVRIYNRALSAAEVRAIFNATRQ